MCWIPPLISFVNIVYVLVLSLKRFVNIVYVLVLSPD